MRLCRTIRPAIRPALGFDGIEQCQNPGRQAGLIDLRADPNATGIACRIDDRLGMAAPKLAVQPLLDADRVMAARDRDHAQDRGGHLAVDDQLMGQPALRVTRIAQFDQLAAGRQGERHRVEIAPVQMTFASSVEPILPVEISITRMAATNEAEQKKRAEGEDGDVRTDNRTMGRKHIVPYGLYVAHGFISAKFAERTGFSQADLDLLFEALQSMFEHDRSAARGEMTARKLIVFRHAGALGNAPAHALFDRIKIGRKVDGEFRDIDDRGLGNLPPARKFADYTVRIDRDGLPEGVEILDLL